MSSAALQPSGNLHPAPLLPLTRITILLFGFTAFLSAFLLFQIQLVVSKYILPWFGGSAAVWTTSMLVFQLLLLAGYIYSHVISVRLPTAVQTRVHAGLLLSAFILILALSFLWPSPITPGPSWKPEPGSDPTRSAATILLISAGIPFFVLATTGPLLQRWFARMGGGPSAYKLYAVSNVGSLLGLVTFPFLLEPTLRTTTQGRLWALLFCGFVIGCAACAWKARNATSDIEPAENTPSAANDDHQAPRLLTYFLWFLLAMCPSSLFLATTNVLCQQVTTVPLLWVLPLSIYLFTFILCFDSPRWYRRSFFQPFFALTLFAMCASLIANDIKTEALLLVLLLFFACMVCHGELVRLKPSVTHLTAFYLTVSAGGAAGGIFVGIIAPRLFSFYYEFQLTLAAIVVLLLVCLLADRASWIFDHGFLLPLELTLGLLFTEYLASRLSSAVAEIIASLHLYLFTLLAAAIAVLCTYILRERQPSRVRSFPSRGFRFVHLYVVSIAMLALAALYRSTQSSPEPYLSLRNFYGAVRVFRQHHAKTLVNGRTLHGLQLDPPNDTVPTTYYGKNSAIGILLENHPKRENPRASLRVGLVGLGAGTLAAYGRPGDYFRYYEINPDVVKLSSGSAPVFTFLRDSAARVDVELGDARLLLERELAQGHPQNFDVLALDAFAGATVPVHLLTREAFETYWQHLSSDGIIAVNITSGHIDLTPVLEGARAYFHADSLVLIDDSGYPSHTSRWVLLARNPAALTIPGLQHTPLSAQLTIPPCLWTDDYSDIFRLERSFRIVSFHLPHL